MTLIGKQAPTITLSNYNGESFTLTPGEGGLPIALFFYPKAGSYGCTKEACQFRDAIANETNFKSEHLKVVGISIDSIEKQKAFVEKNKLTFPVLSDEKGEARNAYGVGKGFLGARDARTTFIIDGKGIVRDSYESTLNFGAHTKFVNKWLAKLAAESDVPAAEAKTAEPAAEPTPAAVA